MLKSQKNSYKSGRYLFEQIMNNCSRISVFVMIFFSFRFYETDPTLRLRDVSFGLLPLRYY